MDGLAEDLAAELARVRRVLAVTGAGISRDSGIPTYRGRGGLYDDPAEGDRTVEALTGSTLARDPDRTWRVVAELARRAAGAAPNAAHRALAAWEADLDRMVVLTQNVDGLHRAAGSREVIEIHGDARATRCETCGRRGRLGAEELAALQAAPRCSGCGAALRPDVVLFGEFLPSEAVLRMAEAASDPDLHLVLAVGTSAAFPYVVEPVVRAARRGLLTVEVNPEPTALTPFVRWHLRAPASEALPLLAAAARASRPAPGPARRADGR